MDIDLLINKMNDVGLVTSGKFESTISAAIFDHTERSLTLEFGETMDSLQLNVLVGEEFIPYLRQTGYLHLIALEKKRIVEARQIPLMHVNDFADEDSEDMAEGGWR